MRRQYSRTVIGNRYCYVFSRSKMSRLLHMNFQSSKFKLKNFVNSWERAMTPTSYSMPPSHMSHAQLDKHIWWRPTKFLFGGWRGHHSHTELGNISEISSTRPQSSGKIFFWIMGIQASAPRCPQVTKGTWQKSRTIVVPWQLQN
jgi:hypothetical protein